MLVYIVKGFWLACFFFLKTYIFFLLVLNFTFLAKIIIFCKIEQYLVGDYIYNIELFSFF